MKSDPMQSDRMRSASESVSSTFSVDVAGLLRALTEQFPDPLLCIRELVQNAADAEAHRIEVDVAFEPKVALVRISVRDDGRGMGADEVQGYLTLGFSSKDPLRKRGRFGIGKVSAFALGFVEMWVETSNGSEVHRIKMLPDGSGTVEREETARPRGTAVHVLCPSSPADAEKMADDVLEVVQDSCALLPIPLYVNGLCVNEKAVLSTPYVVELSDHEGAGVLGLAAESTQHFVSRGIVLETGAAVLGNHVAFIVDGPFLSPTLSRNAVRRDHAFETLLTKMEARLDALESVACTLLRERMNRPKQYLTPEDEVAVEWLRDRLFALERFPSNGLAGAPVFETADGSYVSLANVRSASESQALFTSMVPRPPDDMVPRLGQTGVCLLSYPDLEEFLLQLGIHWTELPEPEHGTIIPSRDWTSSERRLLNLSVEGTQDSKLSRRFRRIKAILEHPLDYWVAKRLSLASLGLGPSARNGSRLPLGRLQLGLIDLRTHKQTSATGPLFVLRDAVVYLNRYHPAIDKIIVLAMTDVSLARAYLESLLATESSLVMACDPRRLEWDLVKRWTKLLRHPGLRSPK